MKQRISRTAVMPPGLARAAALAAMLACGTAAALERAGPITSALRPDLVIVDAQVAPANPSRLRVRVANQGLAPAAETQIELTCRTGDGLVTRVAAIPMLGAGERHWFVLESGLPLDRLGGVTLEIDKPSRIIESDENNNRFVYR